MALKADGTVLTWGFNSSGQLGLGVQTADQNDRSTPVVVSGLDSGSGVIAIAAGGEHSMALKSDDSVAAWGDNTNRRVGDRVPITDGRRSFTKGSERVG